MRAETEHKGMTDKNVWTLIAEEFRYSTSPTIRTWVLPHSDHSPFEHEYSHTPRVHLAGVRVLLEEFGRLVAEGTAACLHGGAVGGQLGQSEVRQLQVSTHGKLAYPERFYSPDMFMNFQSENLSNLKTTFGVFRDLQNILWLEVAVRYAAGVKVLECTAYLIHARLDYLRSTEVGCER